MIKFKKEFKFKIISLLFAGIFFVTSVAYGIDLPKKSHLRKPLLYNSSVSGYELKRSEEAKNKVAVNLSKPAEKRKLLAKLKRKTELAITLGLSVVIVGGIIYLYDGVNRPLVFSQDKYVVKELEKDLLLTQSSRILPEVRTAYNELKKLYGDNKYGTHLDNLAECTKIADFFRNIRNDRKSSKIYEILEFANVDLVRTAQFQDAARFISANFDYYEWTPPPDLFWAALEISKDFESKKEEWKELISFLKAKGDLINVKDCYFLNMIVRSPKMMEKLKDRKELESRISKIYSDNQPVERLDKNMLKYTERPDPSTLSSIALLYVITLYDSFGSKEFQKNMKEIFQKDLDPDDGDQEHGGFFKFDARRNVFLPIEIERLKTLPRDQSSFEIDEILFPGHFFRPSFHLHATSSDDIGFAGPSLSDMGLVDMSGHHKKSYFNAVFTSVGFEDSEHLFINLDAYGLYNNQYFVVDVGTQSIKISVPNPKKSSVINDLDFKRPKELSVDSFMLINLNENAYRAISSGL